MIRLLALDLATCTGFAVDNPAGGDIPLVGHFTVAQGGGENHGRALMEAEVHLVKLIKQFEPAAIAFEAPLPVEALKDMLPDRRRAHQAEDFDKPTTSTLIVRRLFGFAAIAEKVAYQFAKECYECNVQDVRRHLIGNRWATKEAVFDRCKLLKYPVTTHDESDACALWDYARHMLRFEDLTEPHLSGAA